MFFALAGIGLHGRRPTAALRGYRQMTSGFSEVGYSPPPIDIFERPLERMTGEMFE